MEETCLDIGWPRRTVKIIFSTYKIKLHGAKSKFKKTGNRKEYMKEYNKLYYRNRLDKYREKVLCDCGSEVTKYGYHLNSKRHEPLFENKELKLALNQNRF